VQDCDVLIVGGGPAGLSVASHLAADIKCIIVHQDAKIGQPVRTSGGSFLADMKALKIPAEYYQIIDKLDVFSDTAQASINIESDKMVVLDITKLYQYLASLSDKSSRQILLASKFMSAVKQSDGRYISEIRNREIGQKFIRSKYIIDASGWHCAVLNALGLVEKPVRLGVGTEYEFAQKYYPVNRATLFVGSPVSSGYGWVFPTNYNTIRLGAGVIKPDTESNPRDVMKTLIESGFLCKLGIEVPDDYTINSGILPSIAFDSKVVFGNVIRVGDSANCATPIAGEGIRIAIKQGRLLASALNSTISQGNPHKLQTYQTAYTKEYGRDYKIGYWANQRISKYGPKDWDRSVNRISKLQSSEITDLLRSRFNFKNLLRITFLHIKRKILRKFK